MPRRASDKVRELTREEVLDVVVRAVERVGNVPAEALRDRIGDDLIHGFGIDSIKMMRIWAVLEKQCGLEPGDLGFTQVVTIDGLVEQVLETVTG